MRFRLNKEIVISITAETLRESIPEANRNASITDQLDFTLTGKLAILDLGIYESDYLDAPAATSPLNTVKIKPTVFDGRVITKGSNISCTYDMDNYVRGGYTQTIIVVADSDGELHGNKFPPVVRTPSTYGVSDQLDIKVRSLALTNGAGFPGSYVVPKVPVDEVGNRVAPQRQQIF